MESRYDFLASRKTDTKYLKKTRILFGQSIKKLLNISILRNQGGSIINAIRQDVERRDPQNGVQSLIDSNQDEGS